MGTFATAAGGALVGGVAIGALAIGGIAYSTNELVDGIKGEFDLPTIIYTPYTIFSNKVPLFDINFFNPMSSLDENGNSIQVITSVNIPSSQLEGTIDKNHLNELASYIMDAKHKEGLISLEGIGGANVLALRNYLQIIGSKNEYGVR